MSNTLQIGYQNDAVNNALDIFRHAESQLQQVDSAQDQRAVTAHNGCVLLEAPTGAGKTLMAGNIAEQFSRPDHRHNAKLVWFWFTPFANLVEQAKNALKRDFSGLAIRDLNTERKAYSANSGDVFVTTWASVAARNAQTRKLRKNGDLSLALDDFIPELRSAGFRIGVVVDEAHHSFTKATEAVNFYRDILHPDFTLLITATPDDADVETFKKAAGLAVVHRIQVSRQHAVDAGLIKEAVKSVAYLLADDQKQLVNLHSTALEDGWRTHQMITAQLQQAHIKLTPLMLVQVGNTGKAGESAIAEAKQHLLDLGVAEETIAWYTADEPNDDLLTVAQDASKQVLIFKVAVALGFDAPRAFTLVSLRGAKSTDFGIQVVGRILRVHQRLRAQAINKTLPELLRFGYVFLADADSQSGLINAGAKINAITTQLSEITPYTMVVKMAGQSEVQVSSNGQLSLLPQGYNPPVWQPPASPDQPNTPTSFTGTVTLQGGNFSLFGDFIAPPPPQINEPGSPASYRAADRLPLAGYKLFALREGVPKSFKTERLPLGTDELVACISKRIKLTDRELNAGLRKSLKITRNTIGNIFTQPEGTIDSVQARLSNAEIYRRAQKVLTDADYIDPRDLHSLLLARLQTEYNEHSGIDLSEQDLARALHLILATFPNMVRDAARVCAATAKTLEDAEALPNPIEVPDGMARSRLNGYGIMPPHLNNTERCFAQMLDADTSGTVLWWHRNEARKPWSVGIVMPIGDRYFPDFIVGVTDRHHGDGIMLVETKGSHLINNDETQEKISAEHKLYGKPLMLTLQEDGRFWLMRYIEAKQKIEPDQVFRVENMAQY